MTDGKELALLGNRRLYFGELHCPRCGSIRIATTQPIETTTYPCPFCGVPRAAGSLHCSGFMKQPTPFFERVCAPLSRGKRKCAAGVKRPDVHRERNVCVGGDAHK
jgi:hypothetical protein